MYGEARRSGMITLVIARATRISVVVFVTACTAFSAPPGKIDILDPSFETPLAPRVPPYARPAFMPPDDHDWLQTPIPMWWTYGSTAWDQSAGVFFNVPGSLHIMNADGEQVVFLFGTPDLGIYQDLGATYEPGLSYHLSVAIRGGSGGMPLGSPIEVSLYYRNNNGLQIPIAATEFLNENLGSPTSLLDVEVHTPVVSPGDAWACKNIGISILATVKLDEPELQGGTWGIDNVRLNALDGNLEPGDFDNDGIVDLQDYDYFPLCMTAPSQNVTCCNQLSDIDGDGDVDLEDFSLFIAAFTLE